MEINSIKILAFIVLVWLSIITVMVIINNGTLSNIQADKVIEDSMSKRVPRGYYI